MPRKPKLKPCPFCGGPATIDRHATLDEGGKTARLTYAPKCHKCGCELWSQSTAEKAAETWNWREEKPDAAPHP